MQGSDSTRTAHHGAHLLKLLAISRVPPLLVLMHRQRQLRLAHGRQHIHKGRLQQRPSQPLWPPVQQRPCRQAPSAVGLHRHQPGPGEACRPGRGGAGRDSASIAPAAEGQGGEQTSGDRQLNPRG